MFKLTRLICNSKRSQLLFYKIIYQNQEKEEKCLMIKLIAIPKQNKKSISERNIAEEERDSVTIVLTGVETVQSLKKYGNISRRQTKCN